MRAGILLLLCMVPTMAEAGIVMTEVMYDLPGTDTDREWIEILNTGPGSIDFSTHKLFEANTNHGLTIVSGSATLASGAYAIIADVPSVFLADNPSFSGTLLDSSFSLSNTGETLSIKDADGIELDSFAYSSTQGATGDGNSLQKSGSQWVAAAPTPGSAYGEGAPPPPPPPPPPSSASSTTQSMGEGTSNPSTPAAALPTIYADAGDDRVLMVAADALFEGKAYGTDKKPLTGARFVWNFGDGATAEGVKVIHHYAEPGSYALFLEVVSGEYSVSDRVAVEVIESALVLAAALPGYLELRNDHTTELAIEYWRLRSGGSEFLIPRHTIILPRRTLRFSAETLRFVPGQDATLHYPNGLLASTLERPIAEAPSRSQSVPAAKVSTQNQTATPAVIPVGDAEGSVLQETEESPSLSPSSANEELQARPPVLHAQAWQALALGAFTFDEKSYPYLLGLLGLIILAGAALVLSRAGPGASGYTIIEEKEEVQ